MAGTRSCRHNRASASLASQLPQVHLHPAPPRPCGRRLAGDGCYAFLQTQRVACIAGKPAPTSAPTPCATPPLWEPACRRWLIRVPAGTTRRLHRWQARSHKCTHTVRHSASVGSGLPAMAATRSCRHNEASVSLANQLPQVHPHPELPRFCGSRLAGDGWYAFLQAQPGVCIAGKPALTSAPTPCATPPLWESACRRWLVRVPAGTTGRLHRWQACSHKCNYTLRHPASVGAGLPAMAATRSCRHNEASASLASQFPQADIYPCQPPPSAAYTSTNDNDTWAVLSTSAAWLASNTFCTVSTLRKSTVPWAYCW